MDRSRGSASTHGKLPKPGVGRHGPFSQMKWHEMDEARLKLFLRHKSFPFALIERHKEESRTDHLHNLQF